MKPFDLEAAKRGEPIQTRDGRPVVFGGYNPDAHRGGEIAGWIGTELFAWETDGKWIPGVEDRYDLFMAPKKHRREVWHNWYVSESNSLRVYVYGEYDTKKEADDRAKACRVACTMTVVEWEE